MEEQRWRRERLKLSGRRTNGAHDQRELEKMDTVPESVLWWDEDDQREYELNVGLEDGAILLDAVAPFCPSDAHADAIAVTTHAFVPPRAGRGEGRGGALGSC